MAGVYGESVGGGDVVQIEVGSTVYQEISRKGLVECFKMLWRISLLPAAFCLNSHVLVLRGCMCG